MKHLKEVKLRKRQNTSVSERSNVRYDMWRKKAALPAMLAKPWKESTGKKCKCY